MRILSFICVIMVMALNMVPCADVHEKLNDSFPVTLSDPDHAHDVPLNDACTPFCYCACCASTVVVKIIAAPSIPFPLSQSFMLYPYQENTVNTGLSIWQPPKLA